jgi:plastocyanin
MMKSTAMKGIFSSLAALLLMSFTVVGLPGINGEENTKTAMKKAAGATITGTVTYEGKVPKLRVIDMGAEPSCAAKHSPPAKSQALVLGEGNTMANIFVKVKSGLPKKTYDPPKEPVVVDQNGCIYEPHVFGVMVKQPIKFLNSDGILHNVHPLPKKNRTFNLAMPKAIKETVKTFSKVEEEMFIIKCDVHPWMQAYMSVMPHPFYSVTGKDGKFTISGLDAGTYEIEAWHERLGTKTMSVTVKEGETRTVDFTFSRGKKK